MGVLSMGHGQNESSSEENRNFGAQPYHIQSDNQPTS